MNKKIILLISSFLVLFSSGIAQSVNLENKIPFDPNVKIGKLENGLTYYIRENKKPQNRADIRLVVNVGSILEDEDQLGLAHFVEHMAFNGTKNFAKHEIINFMESIGMRFGPEINAYTGFDETVYMLELPLDSTGIFEKGFQILSDWATNISFEDEEIDKERGVIIEEWRTGRGADARIRDKQFPVIFKNSKYAERLPIGKVEILKSFDYETLKKFYKDWYRPELMAVVAVGDFDKTVAEELIIKYFSDVPSSENARERTEFEVPDQNDIRISIESEREAAYNIISVMYLNESDKQIILNDLRDRIKHQFFNMMLNDRFNEITKKSDPPFMSAYSGNADVVRTKEAYTLTAIVKENEVERGLDALLAEAERIKQFGFTQSEFERAKKNSSRALQKQYEERDKIESGRIASAYTSSFLSGNTVYSIKYIYEIYDQLTAHISLEEINSLINKNIKNDNFVVTLSLVQNDSTKIPKEEDILKIFGDISAKNISAYEEVINEEPLLSRIPEPGKIIHEKIIEELDITEWTLSNGVKVVLKPTDFKNDEILFTASSPGGNSLVPKDKYYSSLAVSAIANESGLGNFSNIELRKKMAGKVVSVYPWIGELREGFEGTASPTDVESLFQLLYMFFESPRFDEEAFNSFKSRVKGFLENGSASPESAFQDTIAVTMSNYHFRGKPWSLDLLNEIDLTEAKEIYYDRFANADDFTFYFVGNLDIKIIKQMCEIYLANLPSTNRKETWNDTEVRYPKGKLHKVIKKGIEPKSRVMMKFTGEFSWSPEESYYMNTVADYLNIRLREVIREDIGGTYGVGVWCNDSRWPQEDYDYSISFGCNPENAEELTEEILKQIDTLKLTPPDISYINKIKEQHLRERETNLETNIFWLGALHELYVHERDPKELLNFPKLVNTLSPEVLSNTTKKYFNNTNYVRFILMPEEQN